MSNFEPDEKMLNNYIQNKLNEADNKQLELWLVDHPETIQDLELGLMFAQSKASINPSKNIKWFNLPSVLVGAIAASLLLIPFLLNKIDENGSNEIYSYHEVTFDETRSTSHVKRVKTHSKIITLRFPVEDEWLIDNDEFRVEFVDSENIKQSIIIAPNWDNELVLSLHLKNLKSQKIKVNIYANNKPEQKELINYSIEIN